MVEKSKDADRANMPDTRIDESAPGEDTRVFSQGGPFAIGQELEMIFNLS